MTRKYKKAPMKKLMNNQWTLELYSRLFCTKFSDNLEIFFFKCHMNFDTSLVIWIKVRNRIINRLLLSKWKETYMLHDAVLKTIRLLILCHFFEKIFEFRRQYIYIFFFSDRYEGTLEKNLPRDWYASKLLDVGYTPMSPQGRGSRGHARKILGLSRKSLRSRKRQDSESTDWIYTLLRSSKAVTLYVYRWIGLPLERALCNSDRAEANKSTTKFFSRGQPARFHPFTV